MKIKTLKLSWWAGAMVALALLAGHASAQTVTTIGGGNLDKTPYSGYNTNSTNTLYARFNQPSGLTMDPTGSYLFVADYSNNVVRIITTPGVSSTSTTFTFTNPSVPSATKGISHPIAVAVDAATNSYVLNQGSGANGTVLQFNALSIGYPTLVGTKASKLTNATAMVMDGLTNLYVTVRSNTVLCITPSNVVSVVGVITNRGTRLQGIAVMDNGELALSDAGSSGIWLMNPNASNPSNNVTKLAGFNGIGDNPDSWPVPATNAIFNHPGNIAKAGNGVLVIADNGNHRVKLLNTLNGNVTLFYGVNSNLWLTGQTIVLPNGTYVDHGGWIDGTAGILQGAPEARLPFGVTVAPDASVYVSEDYYHILRHITGTGLTAPAPGYPQSFNSLAGIALDYVGENSDGDNLYIADQANNVIKVLNFGDNTTTTYLTADDGISHPASVLVDTNDNLYVLNQNAGTNGSILEFDEFGYDYGVIATGLAWPTAFTMDGNGNLFVAEQKGAIKVVYPSGAVNTITTIATNSSVSLQGIAIMDNGLIAVSDAGNHVIWTINPITKVLSRLTGQFTNSGTNIGTASTAQLNQPHQLARSGSSLVVADYGNNRLALVSTNGTVTTNSFASSAALLWFGNANDPSTNAKAIPMKTPYGLAISSAGKVYVSEPANMDIRGLTANIIAAPPAPIVPLPYFIDPEGIAFNPAGDKLYVADLAQNTVDLLNVSSNTTTAFLTAADGITNPISVLVDTNENIYVLNQGSSGNGCILEFDQYGYPYPDNPQITGLNQPTAFLMDGYGNLFVTEQSSNILAVFPSGNSSLVATITNAHVSLQGIALFDDGNIAVSDAGNHVIWTVNPITKTVTKLTGKLGTYGNGVGSITNIATLNHPHQLTRVGGNQIVAADYGNNRLVLVQRDGTVTTNSLNSSLAKIWFGQNGDPIANTSSKFVPMVLPSGVAVGNAGVFASETYYQDIRGLTGTGLAAPAFNPGVPLPFYSSLAGIALNSESTILYIADPTNNTVSVLNLANNQTTVFLNSSNGIYQPVDVAVDSSDNLYVLNQGTGGNGSILEFDEYGNLLGTNAASLALPTAMKLSFGGDLYVAEMNGAVQKFNSTGSNTLATINNTNHVQLQGIALLDNGSVVVSDAGNHVLWKISPSATNAVLFTGTIGSPGAKFGTNSMALLNTPLRLAQAYGGLLLIVDSGNNRVVVCDDLGTISRTLNSTNATLWFGNPSDPVGTSSPNYVNMLSPVGLAVGNIGTNGIVFASENVYKDIRGFSNTGIKAPIPPPPAPLNLMATATYNQVSLTWSASIGATNYNVKRAPSSGGPYTIIVSTSATSYTDTSVFNGAAYYYVVSAVNGGGESLNSSEASATVPIPPPPSPTIGWFDFEGNPTPLSTFHAVSGTPYIAHNGVDITFSFAIEPNISGVNTEYTIDGSDPSTTNGSSANPYQDGQQLGQPNTTPLPITAAPVLVIKAVNINAGGSSAIVTAEFLFQAGDPVITGISAGDVKINDVTSGAQFLYTTDGSNPQTNANATLAGPITGTNGITLPALVFPGNTNSIFFQIVAFKANYQTSSVVSKVFYLTNAVYNTISFGFASGEASSDFVASPGQTFYAPVTLSTLSGTTMYSLQFNLTVTNGGVNPGPAVGSGAYGFASMLVKPIPGKTPVVYEPIPPAMFVDGSTLNINPVKLDGSTNFESLLAYNTGLNLLGVGWLERLTKTNLYDTTTQDLIKYSMAHDTLFLEANNKIIVGGYAFQIPANAAIGQTYQIQIARPSATSDGIGASGSGIYISAPTNGSMAGGAPVNALKYVTVGQIKYLVGSVYPFQWFNAGDFGSSNIVNADVMQVFQSAIYSLNTPPAGSDFFDAMDSCGNIGINNGSGVYLNAGAYTATYPTTVDYFTTNYTYTYDTNNVVTNTVASAPIPGTVTIYANVNSLTEISYNTNIYPYNPTSNNVVQVTNTFSFVNQLSNLFDGNDTTINQIAFGDGVLDVCDVYVTYRRSLDPSLAWFERYWNHGVRVADTGIANVASHVVSKAAAVAKATGRSDVSSANTVSPQVNFMAGDIQGTAGQTVQIPIAATILGSYPLRVLMLNLTVEPLDGSPALTTGVQFTQTAALGAPLTTDSNGNGNYSAVWLNSSIDGLTGTNIIGTLTITIPAGASDSAAYAVHFDHVSASPNGLASFPKQTLTGLITLSSHANSSYGDGIPDSWRLRWFGTVNNLLSMSNACPTGDGINNWMKFVAGVDPNSTNDFPRVKSKIPAPSGYSSAIHWPTVAGKKYVIERSSSLFSGSWTTNAIVTGTGADMEYDDNTGGAARFYRVQILPNP